MALSLQYYSHKIKHFKQKIKRVFHRLYRFQRGGGPAISGGGGGCPIDFTGREGGGGGRIPYPPLDPGGGGGGGREPEGSN